MITAARRTNRSIGVLATALVTSLVLSACGVTAGEMPSPRMRSAEGRGSEPAAAPAPPEVIDAGTRSVGLVDTPFASGSAVLLDDGYAVTNAHVVDPFDEVELAFADGELHTEVPVVGVDLAADLALLGPIDTDRPAMTTADPDAITSGEPVHLVGFPGDQDEDEPELDVESGRFARHQYPKNWGLDYLQANVEIRSGQSGGAMVDDQGRLLAVSGLGLEDDVALSLAVDDVERIAAAIADGSAGGPERDWMPVPHTQGERRHDLDLTGPDDLRVLFVSGAAYVDELAVTVSDPDARVALMDPGFYPVAATASAVEAAERAEGLWSFASIDDDIEELDPDAQGRIEIPIEEGEDHLLLVGADAAGPLEVVTAPDSVEVDVVPEPRQLEIGAKATGAIGYLDGADVYELDLVEGQEIQIDAESPSGDLAFVFARPGEPWGEAEAFDGTGDPYVGPGGMLGLDEHAAITVEETGRHTIVVYVADDAPTAYRLLVSEG